MLRRLLLSSMVLFIPAKYTMLRLVVAQQISVLFLAVLFVVNPYKKRLLSAIVRLLQLATVLIFSGCVAIHYCDAVGECTAHFGFDKYTLSLLVLLVGTGVLFLVLLFILKTAFDDVLAERSRHLILAAEEMKGLVGEMRVSMRSERLSGRLSASAKRLTRALTSGNLTEMQTLGNFRLSVEAGGSKFGSANQLVMGQLEVALYGLEYFMCLKTAEDKSTAQIEREWLDLVDQLRVDDSLVREMQPFCKPWDASWQPDVLEAREALIDEIGSWLTYIFHERCSERVYKNGTRDLGRSEDWKLDHFIHHDIAKSTNLSALQVVALRLYT